MLPHVADGQNKIEKEKFHACRLCEESISKSVKKVTLGSAGIGRYVDLVKVPY
jgi:hypothetical protein